MTVFCFELPNKKSTLHARHNTCRACRANRSIFYLILRVFLQISSTSGVKTTISKSEKLRLHQQIAHRFGRFGSTHLKLPHQCNQCFIIYFLFYVSFLFQTLLFPHQKKIQGHQNRSAAHFDIQLVRKNQCAYTRICVCAGVRTGTVIGHINETRER